MRAFREIHLEVPMEPDKEVEASEVAAEMAASVEMDPDRVDEVRMAVVEACINAFEHSRDPQRTVSVDIVLLGTDRPERLEITVRDRGVGFREQDLEGTIQRAGEGPRKRGWGLTIIHELMDEVAIDTSERGTVVTMAKQVGSRRRGQA